MFLVRFEVGRVRRIFKEATAISMGSQNKLPKLVCATG